MKKIVFLFVITTLFVSSLLVFTQTTQAATSLIDKVSGKILLQVEENGEAWYVDPLSDQRYFLNRPMDALAAMRNFGLGITNKNLNLIPVGVLPVVDIDTDKDGLSDYFEISQGTNISIKDTDKDGFTDLQEVENGYSPLNPAKTKLNYDQNLIDRLKGRILLQVEGAGEAWYVNPADGKRYFLGYPVDAFQAMKKLGTGISNKDIKNIPISVLTTNMILDGKYVLSVPTDWQIEKQEMQFNIMNERESLLSENQLVNLYQDNSYIMNQGNCTYLLVDHHVYNKNVSIDNMKEGFDPTISINTVAGTKYKTNYSVYQVPELKVTTGITLIQVGPREVYSVVIGLVGNDQKLDYVNKVAEVIQKNFR